MHGLSFFLAVLLLAPLPVGYGQSLTGEALIKALQKGGCVIVMRHAKSPSEPPTAQSADVENIDRERQLDTTGRASAIAMGKALHTLQIPVGMVYISPTYRARETARLAQLPNAQTINELGDNGRSMQNITEAQAAWLRKNAMQFPSRSNTFLVTQFPNIARAFPQWSSGLSDGEALVLGSDGKGGAALIGRIKIEDWPKLGP